MGGRGVEVLFRSVGVLALILMTLAVFAEIVRRFAWHFEFYGLDLIAIVLLPWVIFVGAVLSSAERSHIKAEVINLLLKNKHKKTLHIIHTVMQVFGLMACVTFSYWSYTMLHHSLLTGQKLIAIPVPITSPQASLLFGFVMMSFYFLIDLTKHIVALKNQGYLGGELS